MKISSTPLRALGIIAGLVGLAASFLVIFPACNTPFIPLPPPGDPTFTPVMVSDGRGESHLAWQARGAPSAAMSGAKVTVYNLDGGTGLIVRAQTDGSYLASPFEGKVADRIQIGYEDPEGHPSQEICRVLGEGVARTSCPRK
jgi:hypothetical protein